MKLNNYTRDAFVRAVMDDVPKIDYEGQVGEVIHSAFVARLPNGIKSVYERSDLRDYLNLEPLTIRHNGVRVSLMVPAIRNECPDIDALPDAVREEVRALADKAEEQNEKLKSLKASVKAVAYGSTTRKSLIDKLPEFAKYLPRDEEKPAHPIAMANVVSEFMQAGWPKDKVA